jgi:hypothetical protein
VLFSLFMIVWVWLGVYETYTRTIEEMHAATAKVAALANTPLWQRTGQPKRDTTSSGDVLVSGGSGSVPTWGKMSISYHEDDSK